MSFRRRITLVSAAAVAIAVILAALLVYVLTSDQLRSQVDNQLRSHAREAARLQRLFAGPPDRRAVNVRIILDSLPGVAAPLDALGAAPVSPADAPGPVAAGAEAGTPAPGSPAAPSPSASPGAVAPPPGGRSQ